MNSPPESSQRLSSPASGRWQRWVRPVALVVVIGVVATLAVAVQLTPDPEGVGTHEQLGLAPCSMRLMFGIRCPGCGMTTSWSHFVRLQWLRSIAANPGGFLLAAFSLVFATVAGRVVLTGRLPALATQTALTVGAVAIVAVTFVHWLYRLWFVG